MTQPRETRSAKTMPQGIESRITNKEKLVINLKQRA